MHYPLKSLIVEDNSTDAELLTIYLRQKSQIFQWPPTVATNLDDAALILSTTKFGVSFIDYNLGNSQLWYDLIELVGIKNMGVIVSHTATKESELERTQKARDYILLKKTLTPTGMAKFLVDLDERVKERHNEIQIALATAKDFSISMGRNKPIRIVSIEHIVAVVAYGVDSKQTMFYLSTKEEIESNLSFGEALARLKERDFLQVFKGTMINATHVHSLSFESGGGTLVLNHEKFKNVIFSETYSEQLKDRFNPKK